MIKFSRMIWKTLVHMNFWPFVYKRGNGQIWLLVSDLEIVHNVKYFSHLNAQSVQFISRFKSNYVSQIFSVLLRFWPHSILIFNACILQSLTPNFYILHSSWPKSVSPLLIIKPYMTHPKLHDPLLTTSSSFNHKIYPPLTMTNHSPAV